MTRLADRDIHRRLRPHVAAVEVPTRVIDGAEYVLCDDVERAAGLVVFARTGLMGSIALDERSGGIVELLDQQRRRASPTPAEFLAVAATLRAWFEQSDPVSPSERIDGFRPSIEARYPNSFTDGDGYWATLLDDISIGDYDAE